MAQWYADHLNSGRSEGYSMLSLVKSYHWLKNWNSSGCLDRCRWYRVSVRSSLPGVSVLWLGEMASLISNFCLGMAAHKNVEAAVFLRYIVCVTGVLSNQETNTLSCILTPPFRNGILLCRGAVESIKLLEDIYKHKKSLRDVFNQEAVALRNRSVVVSVHDWVLHSQTEWSKTECYPERSVIQRICEDFLFPDTFHSRV